MFRNWLIALFVPFVFVIGFMSPAPADPSPAAPKYVITDLGPPAGFEASCAAGINNKGQIIGFADAIKESQPGRHDQIDQREHVLLWSHGLMRDLGVFPGTQTSEGLAINDKGEIVGDSWFYPKRPPQVPGVIVDYIWGEAYRAFLWRNGNWVSLAPPGSVRSRALGINNTGQIVGFVDDRLNGVRAVLWDKGVPKILGTQKIHKAGVAFSINNAGVAVGTGGVDAFVYGDGFVYSNANVKMLSVPAGYKGVKAIAISDKNQVIGYAINTGWYNDFKAFSLQNGHLTLLDKTYSRSEALAVNSEGQIVGDVSNDPGYYDNRAVLWEQGKMDFLDDLVSPNSGWQMEEARGINNAGLIVGVGKFHDKQHGFLLTPTH